MTGSPDKLRFGEPVVVREQDHVRRLRSVQDAIDWIAYDSPPQAHAFLQDAMKMLLLASGTGLANDVAAARERLVDGLKAANLTL
jgi:hypothetical protein